MDPIYGYNMDPICVQYGSSHQYGSNMHPIWMTRNYLLLKAKILPLSTGLFVVFLDMPCQPLVVCLQTKLIPNISQSRKFHQKYKFQLQYNLQHIFIRDQRVPDTRPEHEIFFNTRSIPDLFSKSPGIFGYRVFQKKNILGKFLLFNIAFTQFIFE